MNNRRHRRWATAVLSTSSNQVLVDYADIRQSNTIVVATEDDGGYNDNWKIQANLICATV